MHICAYDECYSTINFLFYDVNIYLKHDFRIFEHFPISALIFNFKLVVIYNSWSEYQDFTLVKFCFLLTIVLVLLLLHWLLLLLLLRHIAPRLWYNLRTFIIVEAREKEIENSVCERMEFVDVTTARGRVRLTFWSIGAITKKSTSCCT